MLTPPKEEKNPESEIFYSPNCLFSSKSQCHYLKFIGHNQRSTKSQLAPKQNIVPVNV